MRGRLTVFLSILIAAIAITAGCLKGGNFVYSKGKSLSPGESLSYSFTGPVHLTVRVSSNVPVDVRIVGESTVLKDFGETRKVDAVVQLPKGKWKVIIKNPGEEKATLDIELKGS
ncbi:hypothetical protein [Thermococcus sp.]|uniref:hypothetical protein n=1 Tax=Thermococcus sp. TaxID=35749 RepID=UPI00261E15E4|nr:hypothetical protein [Thermococcus sp.]